MTTELAAAVGGGLGGGGALAATPLAIRVAIRTGFYDRPRGYREHATATPFLGGAAVLMAFLIAAISVGGAARSWVLLVCGVVMWAVGTLDDRYAVTPQWRLLAEATAAGALFASGFGWKVAGSAPLDLILTVLWTVGLVNAFNLMDNLDGACGTVGCASALGLGVLAALHGEPVQAGMAFGLAAACAGFLRSNLARPAKIFLGDGGSMTVGFLIAALGMAIARPLRISGSGFLTIAPIAGVVILDTTLVCVSRTRRGVSLPTGGRDHLTHRLLARLGSPRAVAAALALLQGSLAALAIVGDQLGGGAVLRGRLRRECRWGCGDCRARQPGLAARRHCGGPQTHVAAATMFHPA